MLYFALTESSSAVSPLAPHWSPGPSPHWTTQRALDRDWLVFLREPTKCWLNWAAAAEMRVSPGQMSRIHQARRDNRPRPHPATTGDRELEIRHWLTPRHSFNMRVKTDTDLLTSDYLTYHTVTKSFGLEYTPRGVVELFALDIWLRPELQFAQTSWQHGLSGRGRGGSSFLQTFGQWNTRLNNPTELTFCF